MAAHLAKVAAVCSPGVRLKFLKRQLGLGSLAEIAKMATPPPAPPLSPRPPCPTPARPTPPPPTQMLHKTT